MPFEQKVFGIFSLTKGPWAVSTPPHPACYRFMAAFVLHADAVAVNDFIFIFKIVQSIFHNFTQLAIIEVLCNSLN